MPPRPLQYIAGSYRAPTEWEVRQNIEHARAAAAKVLAEGEFFPITPHLLMEGLGGIVDDTVFIEHDLEVIRRLCSSVLMLKGWETSEGARREHAFAIELGLPILYES